VVLGGKKVINVSTVKANRRCNNRIHKKYRCYRSDIWSKLALKGRYNFMTKLIANFAEEQMRFYIRKLPEKDQKAWRIKFKRRRFNYNFSRFAYQLTTTGFPKRKKKPKRRGLLVKLRRQVSLFYGGGRIRSVTFRRYSSMGNEKAGVQRYNIDNKLRVNYYPKKTYASIVESRLDVFLLRTNLVESIYQARQMIFHRKCIVNGENNINHPSYLVDIFQQVFFRQNYFKRMKTFIRNKLRSRKFIGIPYYIYVNYSLLFAVKIEQPKTNKIKYPFTFIEAPCNVFRFAFKHL